MQRPGIDLSVTGALDFRDHAVPVFFKPGHYDITYTVELLESLRPEDRSALLLYDNDFFPLYQQVS